MTLEDRVSFFAIYIHSNELHNVVALSINKQSVQLHCASRWNVYIYHEAELKDNTHSYIYNDVTSQNTVIFINNASKYITNRNISWAKIEVFKIFKYVLNRVISVFKGVLGNIIITFF